MSDLIEAAAALAARCRAEPALSHTSSLLLAHQGTEVAAYDLHGAGLDEPVPNIASITKSLVSTVAGWARHDGLVRLDDTLGDLLGKRVPPERRGATVHHLLTMTSGAAGDDDTFGRLMRLPRGWADELLLSPQAHPAGTVFRYDNGAMHLLAVALHEVTGGLDAYARDRALPHSGCADVIWPADPEGVPYGFGGARLSPRALLRFGEAWRTAAAVPEGYRDLAWTAHTPDGAPIHLGYGYLWWVGQQAGVPVHIALGWAGQCVLVAPDAALTVVTTGARDRWRDGLSRQPHHELAPLVAAASGQRGVNSA